MLTDEMRVFLDEPRFASLATLNENGTIQQTVMWYKLRGDRIVMNTARGRAKDRNLRRDPRLSICVEDGYRYLSVAGAADLIDDSAIAQADIAELATRYHGAERAAAMVRDSFGNQERVTVLLSIGHVVAAGFDGTEG